MPKPLETYAAWEQEHPSTTCHVMVIERGDGSAAQRLTVTDKPYVDKGVSGVRYHHTYPAPVHCIQSDIVTDESFDGSRFQDITLTTFEGDLDDVLTSYLIKGKPFVMYRGDSSWSLLETDFPYRFVEIFRGTVTGAVLGSDGTIKLSLVPVSYDFNGIAAYPDSPLAFGICYNVPAYLVDAATLKYRVNTYPTSTTSADRFRVFDNGARLTETTDFAMILEDEDLNEDVSGIFRGKFQLVLSPSGSVTASLNYDTGAANVQQGNALWLIYRAVQRFYYPTYLQYTSRYDMSAVLTGYYCTFKPDGTKCYIGGASGGTQSIKRFSMSTAWDVSTMSYDSVTFTVPDYGRALQFSSDGLELYWLEITGIIRQYTLSSAWDQSTGTLTGSSPDLDSFGMSYSTFDSMFINGDNVYVPAGKVVYKLTMTSGDITTLTGAVLQVDLGVRLASDNEVSAVAFSSDGKKFYYSDGYGAPLIRQLDLPTAYDLTEVIDPKRSYFYEAYKYSMLTNALSGIHVTPDGSKLLMLHYGTADSSNTIIDVDGIVDGDLPKDLLRYQYSSPYCRIGGNYIDISIGMFYNSETTKADVISDMVGSFGASYYVARDGSIASTMNRRSRTGPLDRDTYYEMDLSAMVGGKGQHIKHLDTLLMPQTYSVVHTKNFNPIPESTSAGTLTDAEKLALATPKQFHVETSTTDDGRTQLIDGFCAFQEDAEAVVDALQISTSGEQVFEIQAALWWQGAISRFDVGSLITFVGDVRHGYFSDPDYGMTLGRKINWSKALQTLKVQM